MVSRAYWNTLLLLIQFKKKSGLVRCCSVSLKSESANRYFVQLLKCFLIFQKYTEWESVRASVLDKQTQEVKRQNKLAVLKKMKESLAEQEKLLTFFEHEEEIELKLEEIEQREEAEMERVLALPHAARKLKKLEKEEEYVPPKISKHRS